MEVVKGHNIREPYKESTKIMAYMEKHKLFEVFRVRNHINFFPPYPLSLFGLCCLLAPNSGSIDCSTKRCEILCQTKY